MIPRRTLPVVALAVVLASFARGQDKPGPPAPPAPDPGPGLRVATSLQATALRTADDVTAILDRLDRLATLEKLGTLGTPQALAELRAQILATASSVVVSGTLEDVPLTDALDAVLKSAGKAGGRVSVVLASADREALAALRVSATFNGARDVDAVRALLRLHESAHEGDRAFVEWSEDAGVFVVRATKLDREPEQDPSGQPLVLEPFREPPSELRAWLGVSWVDQNPRGPGAGGVRITQVLPDSPAVAAGLQAGDLITGFGEDGDEDNAVLSGDDLRQRIAGHAPGDVVIVVFVREGAVRRVSLVLGTTPR